MKITVYTKPNCKQCNFTKRFLDDAEKEYDVVDTSLHPEVLENLKEQGFKSLPVVEVEGQESFSGFQPDRLEAL